MRWRLGDPADPCMGAKGPLPLLEAPPHCEGGRAQTCSLLQFTRITRPTVPRHPVATACQVATGAQGLLHGKRVVKSDGVDSQCEGVATGVTHEKREAPDGSGSDQDTQHDRTSTSTQSSSVSVRELRRVLVQGDECVGAHQVSRETLPYQH